MLPTYHPIPTGKSAMYSCQSHVCHHAILSERRCEMSYTYIIEFIPLVRTLLKQCNNIERNPKRQIFTTLCQQQA